jgi:hypothetical protein
MFPVPLSGSRPPRRLALALMLTTSLTLTAVGAAAPAHADAWDVFQSSHYIYCDAVLVSKLWKISVDNAKTQIGQKIINGIGDNVQLLLRESRSAGNRCAWEDTGYSYNDAAQLAQLWGVGVQQAKAKIANYLTQGHSDTVNGALGHGPSN